MKPILRPALRALRLAALLLFSAGTAGAQFEIRTGAFNDLYQGGIPVAPPTEPPLTYPAQQFALKGETSSTTSAIGVTGPLTAQYPRQIYVNGTGQPTGAATVLVQSQLGNAFSSGVPRYFLGDFINPPLAQADGVTPAGPDYWRGQPVQPGEVINHTSGGPETPISTGAVLSYYYSPHAQRVFASQPGNVSVKWVTRVPATSGRYQYRDETFGVSAASLVPVRQLYWTERSFKAPAVTIPGGRIQAVNPVYTPFFPSAVAGEYQQPGIIRDPNAIDVLPEEKRTLWLNTNGGSRTLRAYNIEGRILVEFLGSLRPDGVTYEFLGAEVLEVAQVARESVVTVKLGEQILPEDGDSSLYASPVIEGGLSNLYSSTTRPDGRVTYYAERENNNADRIQFYWLESLDAAIRLTTEPAQLDLRWPKYFNKYVQVWPAGPEEYAQLVVPSGGSNAQTGVVFGNGTVPQVVFQDDGSLTEAVLDLNSQRLLVNPVGGTNRSLLKFVSGTEFWYVRLYTQDEPTVQNGTRDGTSFSGNATVGDRIERPGQDYAVAGFISGGTGYAVNAWKNPYQFGVEAASAGAVIPVNAMPGDRELTVWWFRKVNPPNGSFPTFHVASRVGHYTVSYPASPANIVMASNLGSGSLGPSETAGALYIQNDRTQPGYNPNEEHALMLSGRVYALRDDLNISGTDAATYTSEPFALLGYTDAQDSRPAMRAFKIQREDDVYKFDYPVTAGVILQGPMPLPLLPLALDESGAVKNREVTASGIDNSPDRSAPVSLYDKFTFLDRKGFHWVYRGPHSGTRDADDRLEFQFYYPMQPGFFIPGTAQPDTGTPLPYLRPLAGSVPQGDPVTGLPITVIYRPEWPVAPELRVAETLTLPKFGLPAVAGQTSAEILYQQSIAQQGPTRPATVLHDPTRFKTIGLTEAGMNVLPGSAATTGSFGRIYFQLLPPHLQKRFYYEPLTGPKGTLVLRGNFVNEIAGEDYLDLNVLSASDEVKLKAIVDASDTEKAKWDAAIMALKTRLETFIENPARAGTYIPDSTRNRDIGRSELATITDADTAVDSYALTATGRGAGYVTLLFGDGEAFTPTGEPVSVKVIKVTPQLYTGDLKVLLSDNPLDEQVSLRHSGDFAARPEDYEFEWRYAPPQDGVSPPVYLYTMQTMLGGGGANDWRFIQNPGSALPAAAQFAGAPIVNLPRNTVIRNAAYNPAGGFPGAVLQTSAPLDFSAGVPQQFVLSAELNILDGFVVYVNGSVALASNAPGFGGSDSTTGLSPTGLTRQWSLDANFFSRGPNTVTIALYTAANTGFARTLDIRLEGSVETDKVVAPGSPWLTPNGTLTNIAVVGGDASTPLGSPLLAMSDNYFTMRYRARASTGSVAGTQWSRWMPAKLVEGWIKRVLAGINPFNQRIRDLLNNPVNTDVSLLTQAGTRWEGDVALNLANINDFGLIEIYETVLKRGKAMSIESGYDYAPANDALLLAAGYLNDLYQILGNEAYADAANPTISIDDQTTVTEVNTSRFSFESQVSSVLEEELALLRGRDDFLSPGVQTAPAYNRLYWNYTRGINSGEALYAVNYNIKEKAGSPTANGVLDAADAQRMFPQGHGDAYGHYLTALTGYYSLLTNPFFTWVPRSEAVTVLGQAVQVDYADERKFARAAANVARSAQQILALTHRLQYRDDPSAGWSHFRDGKPNPRTGVVRHSGLDEWTSRAAQGALFSWVAGNAILPERDTNPNHTGVQVIDRTTVPELNELVSSLTAFQNTADNANARLNPLGLSPDSIAFDISPSQLQQGRSHFEQVYERALRAVLNAKGAFDQAAKMTRLLRNQENQTDDYNAAIVDQESAFVTQLKDIFGTPYSGDIGPGRTYAQDYEGPDLVNWFVVNRPTDLVDTTQPVTITVPVPQNVQGFTGDSIADVRAAMTSQTAQVPVTIQPNQFLQYVDLYRPNFGQRASTGKLQEALLDVHEAQLEFIGFKNNLESLLMQFDREHQRFNELMEAHRRMITLSEETHHEVERLDELIAQLNIAADNLSALAEFGDDLADGFALGYPDSNGTSNDFTFGGQSASKIVGSIAVYAVSIAAYGMNAHARLQEPKIAEMTNTLERTVEQLGFTEEEHQAIYEYELLFDEIIGKYVEAGQLAMKYQRASEQVRNVLAEGATVLSDREVFRQRAAAIVQGYRTRDLTFRTFRNEALEQYRTLYDLAGRYTYLATKSYDYETGLLGSPEGDAVISSIVSSRSLGDLAGGIPQATTSTLGDSGLAGVMARLQSDWSVVKGRLGINNPDTYGTLFSLRGEAFRILNSSAITRDDAEWRQTLERHIVRNLLTDPDAARYCANLRKPDGSAISGIILPFSTTIEHGKNFFGLPLAGGDHTYSASSFATKIFSVGMCFPGYIGMDPVANGTPFGGPPDAGNSLALSATPYVYLIPSGSDIINAPALGDTGASRMWQVNDQALPLPFNLGATSFSTTQFFTSSDTLTEQPWIIRKHQAFRVVSEPALFYSRMPDEFTCRRLVGRSASNTQWKLIIPAYTLLNNEQEGLSRFVASVTDIQLFLRTYSHAGN